MPGEVAIYLLFQLHTELRLGGLCKGHTCVTVCMWCVCVCYTDSLIIDLQLYIGSYSAALYTWLTLSMYSLR